MSVLGIGLMFVGVVGLIVGLFAHHRVRHLSSVSMWLTISALALFAGLALQAAADGWDFTK